MAECYPSLLSQCPKAGCCYRLDGPHALRLGVLKKRRKNVGMMSNRRNPIFFPMPAELHSASESSCLSEIGVDCENVREIVTTNKRRKVRTLHVKKARTSGSICELQVPVLQRLGAALVGTVPMPCGWVS